MTWTVWREIFEVAGVVEGSIDSKRRFGLSLRVDDMLRYFLR
jgi:hypothetical protein